MEATYTDLVSPYLGGTIINKIHDDVSINNSLKNIFSTPIGSVPGKPYFGTRLHSMVFEFIDDITINIMTEIIKGEIAKFEPRIELSSIKFDNYPEYNRMSLTINYTYVIKNNVRSSSAIVPIQL